MNFEIRFGFHLQDISRIWKYYNIKKKKIQNRNRLWSQQF
jgi:hypothetical protein